jgi:hypothetical protein
MPDGGAGGTNLEMSLRIGDDLAIGGMIGSLNGNDSAAAFWVPIANIFGELSFCAGWSKDQDLAGIADGVHDLFEEFLTLMDVAAAYGISLVMNVLCRYVGMQDDFVDAGQADMKDTSLQMVGPDDRMEMMLHHVVPVTGELNWCFLRESAVLDL